MIEATCSACGTLNRIAEADVPAGAKFVGCTSCKSRVPLPVKVAPGATLPKLPPPVPPKGPPPVSLGAAGVIPAPPPAGGNKGDIIDLSDLPAPKRQSPLGAEASRPAPKSALSSALEAELPMPKPKAAPGPAMLDLDDLLAPVSSPGITDLPAPKSAMRPPTPRPAAPEPAEGISDLPAPRGRASTPSTAPRAVPASSAPIVDLPAPKSGGARALADLPAPKMAAGVTDLPTPKVSAGVTDLPAPKGPSPGGAVDLPAPKGFFDDLPQPARAGNRPEQPEVPAPKGFFDDLPQPARGSKGGPGGVTNDIAPKGFFDDLPQKAPNHSGSRSGGAEPPAPKGFFDDFPVPVRAHEQNVAPKGAFGSGAIDLGDDPIEPIDLAPEEPGLDLAPPTSASSPSPARPTGKTVPPGSAAGSFDDLDLSAPSTPQTRIGAEEQERAEAGIKFSAAKKSAPAAGGPPPKPGGEKATLPSFSKSGTGGSDSALELEEPRDKGGQLANVSQRLGPRLKDAPVNEALVARQKKRRMQMFAGAAVAFALLGGGGFYMYRRHAAQQERADAISAQLAVARKAMAAEDANHWQRASTAALQVIELDSGHAEAYGIAAESSIAGALADGKNGTARIAKGKKLISDALAAGVTGPSLERAQALSTLTIAPDKAIAKLDALLAKSPKDAVLALYLGWAHAATSNVPGAIKAFDQAAAGSPAVKALALIGRARVKLVSGDIEGARADFTTVLETDKDNIPAQVGLAATLPAAQAQQQESDLLAILSRKDVATSDPRAVVQAWVLAADLARKGGRRDAARERYRKALAVDAKDVAGNTGLAEIELQEKRIDSAAELITKVLTHSPNDANAQLVQCEIALAKSDIKDAEARIKVLADRVPPLAPLDQARLHMVKGKLHELRKDHEAAVDEFIAGAKLAGDRDLAPTFAAIAKLTAMAKDAAAESNLEKEAKYKGRADELLLALARVANDDPQLALTLGNAYLQSGDAEKAEPWLRRVIAARPTDTDALYVLGKVLRTIGKGDEAVQYLKKATELAPMRAEIGMELARTYELIKRDSEAGQIYDKLLAEPEPTIELRGYAGKYFVRTGKLDKAGEQGTKILEADKQSAAGHYLKGEGQLAAGHIEDARKEFTEAVTAEHTALYLDAQGRATESLSMQRNDLALQDAALRSYIAATELDPTMFSPLIGMGRLYVARREMAKAVVALLAANKLKPDDAEVAFFLGRAYQVIGTKDTKKAAIEWLMRSNKLEKSAEASNLLGQLYQDADVNQPGPAIEHYRAATKLATDAIKKTGKAPSWYPEALYQLGALSDSTGDEGTACKAFQQFIGTNPPPDARTDEVKRKLLTSLKGGC